MIAFCLLATAPISSFASDNTGNSTGSNSNNTVGITCLSNGNSISIGENQKQIIQACGDPTNTENTTQPITKDRVVTHWYYLTQLSTDDNSGDSTYSIIRIVVQFSSKGIVTGVHIYTPTNTDISAEQIDLVGYVILVGDDKEQVLDILGKPFETKKLVKPEQVGKKDIATWTYTTTDSDKNTQTQQLTFIDKTLTEVQNL